MRPNLPSLGVANAPLKSLGAGAAAIAAGVLFFLSNLFGEFLLPAEKDGEIVRLGLFLVYVAAYGLGAVALVFALRALSSLHRGWGELTRAGHNGLRVAAAGAALQALFAVVYFATAAATGDAAEAAFFLFALGFLLLIGGSLTAGISMIRTGIHRRVGALLLVAVVAAIVTIVASAPAHDVGLFVFDAAWIGLGLVLTLPVRSDSASHRVLSFGAVAALSLVVGGSAATASPNRTSPGEARLRAALDGVVAAGVPGALVLVREGDRTVRLAAGSGNLASRTPMRVTDRFRIGSETKTFVSTVVLQLVGEGKLSLDDTLERRLPGLIPNGSNITVRQLLNHTSGLYDYAEDKAFLAQLNNRRKVWAPRKLIALGTAHKPVSRPGTAWGYSNTGYIALGLIVEGATGHSLGTELRRRIFEPLHLRATSFDRRPQIAGRYAHGYSRLGKQRLYDVSFVDPSLFWAAGAIVSTAEDLTRFHDALLRGRLLRPNLLAAMRTTVNVTPEQGYGLGLIRWRSPCGTFWGHGGGIFGYETFAASTGDGRRHVVIALNADESVQSPGRDDAVGRLMAIAHCG